tara:strand:+ start:19 stop:399 length:381 start_codon:yes stop_codon:yes gene_type:complete
MGKIFVIEHSAFDSQTTVAVDVSDKKLVKWIDDNTVLEVDDEMRDYISLVGEARTVLNGNFTMIRLGEWTGSNYNIAVLAHEAFHLAEFIFDRIGVKYDMEISGEVFAYFIQSTVKQILDVLEGDK